MKKSKSLALQVLSNTFVSLGIIWRFWLSGYCLALLALRVLSGTFGSLGIVWHFWLSGYYWLTRYYYGHYLIKMILSKNILYELSNFKFKKKVIYKSLALQVLSGAFGSPGIVWRFWLSGYCLALLALWVLSSTLGSLGITGSPGIIMVII